MNPIHRVWAGLLPLIRFFHETVLGNAWYDEIVPGLWLGGAPLYERDYRFLIERGVGAVLDLRREGHDDLEIYRRADIVYLRLPVLDALAPSSAVISRGTGFIHGRLRGGRTVLVHCAKGRGRAPTLVAAYLMKHHGSSFSRARAILEARRPSTKLRRRHRRRLESWASVGGIDDGETDGCDRDDKQP
jgi:hypothetical protein